MEFEQEEQCKIVWELIENGMNIEKPQVVDTYCKK